MLSNLTLAGVHAAGIHWYRRSSHQFVLKGRTGLDLRDAVACFASPLTNELLIVCQHGDPIRVSIPA
jgi:hypothetical protein